MPPEDRTHAADNAHLSPRAVRRHDDAARFLERFAALTGVHLHSASIEALPRKFLAAIVEAPNLLVERYGYELEPRTRNALCRYEPGRPQDPWTVGRLLEIRGFGVFSLLDLVEILAKHGIRPGG